mmetsp:Transcript_38798/g.89551  ORF Transcript_38798/g.89551 Transcript_38798/m.89551 type:complete len:966 (+) Transcript_38798:91-2988(+)
MQYFILAALFVPTVVIGQVQYAAKSVAVAEGCEDDSHLGLLQKRAQGLALVQQEGTRSSLHGSIPATGGLKAEFFYLTKSVSTLAEVGFQELTADITRIDPDINYASTSESWHDIARSDHFAARWTGSIRIDEAGSYKFRLSSDDGSRLKINKATVVDNDGLHAMFSVTGTVQLSAGDHPIEVLFFERTGGGGCIMSYSGPDTSNEMEVVPQGALVPNAIVVDEDDHLTTPSRECPDECKAPSCLAGDFASGGWLLDDGVCTVTCSEPDEAGVRQCGRGAAFENSQDSIDCSGCVKLEDECGQCVMWGDPHIVPFDRDVRMQNGRGSNVDLYKYGDYWIVKSTDVHIQGRYWSSKYRGNSMTRGLAVGGPFLKGNLLMVEPLDGSVKWNGVAVVTTFPSTFEAPDLIYIRYHDRAEVVRTGGNHRSIKGLEIMLPLGVRITVNRFSGHLDVLITMHTLPGGLDGHCGNCNHDETDDTRQKIYERSGQPCEPREDLFTVKEYSPVGCYVEDLNDRDLTVKKDINMNDEECSMACVDYKWFGIQLNGQCFCGDTYGKHGEADACNCPHEEGATGDVGAGKQCIYGYFDSEQPPEQTLEDDCDAELKEKAEKLCGDAFASEEVDDPHMKKLCMADVCFGSDEFADEDAWAAHETLPCASVADIQGACGKTPEKEGYCKNAADCDMTGCAPYQALGWFQREIRLLADGQALGTGHMNKKVIFEHRDGICVTDKGTLEVCSNGQCAREASKFTTTTTTKCEGKDCTFWGDPHIQSFDKLNFDDTREGDKWLVKSHNVFIQGRFGLAKNRKRSFLKAVAIGGPFIEGNTLTMGTGEGAILWNDKQILSKLDTLFQAAVKGSRISVSYKKAVENVNDPNHTTNGLHIHLPNGIELVLDRFPTWLGLRISQEHPLQGGQDGICGNFNDNTNDDSLKALSTRMNVNVNVNSSLFHSYAKWMSNHGKIVHQPHHL